MRFVYNDVAGSSLDRLSALSDGVFAFAMTLLVLDLHVPRVDGIHSEHDLWLALLAIWPRFTTYLMSFMTLGIFWVGQQTQLNHLSSSNIRLSWIAALLLTAVTVIPFSTALLAEFIAYRIALLAYWLNIFCLGAALYLSWGCATKSRLVKDDIGLDVPAAVCRRIEIAQALYALGALLCIVNTRWSIAFIVLVQLYYALAPRLPK